MKTMKEETKTETKKNVVPNFDAETGIHYGAIHQNSLCSEAFSDIHLEARDLSYESMVSDIKAEFRDTLDQWLCDCQLESAVENAFEAIEDDLNDSYSGEKNSWLYEKDGYILTSCLDFDIMVIKSPFFTYARACSPCVPNAGDLNNPFDTKDGFKTYCLPAEFFEDDKIPYNIYSVETGERI